MKKWQKKVTKNYSSAIFLLYTRRQSRHLSRTSYLVDIFKLVADVSSILSDESYRHFFHWGKSILID